MQVGSNLKFKIHSEVYQRLLIFRSLTDRMLVFSAKVNKVNCSFYFNQVQLEKQTSSLTESKPIPADISCEQSHQDSACNGRAIMGFIVINQNGGNFVPNDFLASSVTEYTSVLEVSESGFEGKLLVTDLNLEISGISVEIVYDLDKDLEEDCLRMLNSQVVEL